jgi:site-specific DNA recombinase
MEILGIYSRVSSKSQEDDGTSIDYQIRKGNEISKRLKMTPKVYNEGGKSSWDSNINTRPKLVELLNDIENRKITSVWCWNMDRIGRNSQSWYSIFKILIGWKVELYVGESLKPYDFNNPTDKLVMNVLSLITTYDNELRTTRMKIGKMESLKKGQTFIGGSVPFGYDVKKKMLIPNLSEKEYLIKMFEMCRDGKSTTEIKVMLDNSEHKPTRSLRGWNLQTIRKQLTNTMYDGKQVWNWMEKEPDGTKVLLEKIEIKTPRLIRKKLFNDVKEIFNTFKKSNQYDTDLVSMLKGLLECRHCGFPMNHRMKKKHKNKFYYCVYTERMWTKIDRTNLPKWKHSDNTCEMKQSPVMEQTDKLVWNKFLEIFQNSNWVKEQYKSKGLEPKTKQDKEVKTLIQSNRDRLVKHRKHLNVLNDSIVEVELRNIQGELSSKDVYQKLMIKLQDQIQGVSKQIEEVEKELKRLQGGNNWVDWVTQMKDEIDSMKDWTIDEKKEKLNQFIQKIYVKYLPKTMKHKLEFKFRVPIVGDKIVYNDKKDKTKGYKVIKGETKVIISHKNKSLPTLEKRELMSLMVSMKDQGLNFSEMCRELNKLKKKTLWGKDWSKQSVRRFYFDFESSYDLVFNPIPKSFKLSGKKKGLTFK